tara:strand:+ start:5040 stop:7214 length:2175 start_codon:yes stop_codon:yes gene_type:complete
MGGFGKGRDTTPPLILRNETGRLITPSEVAARIENFVDTPEGTLASVHGPAPLVPKIATYDQDTGGYTYSWPTLYGRMHGVFHAYFESTAQDVLIVHSGSNIAIFQGWKPSDPWYEIIGEASTNPQITVDLVDDPSPQFPTQFERTPKGVVIVPQNGRAYICNGEVTTPLGYDSAPATPLGYGPETVADASPNAKGYSIDRASAGYTLHKDWGYGRLGTIVVQPLGVGDGKSYLLEGMYQAAVQWVDMFGNLSPISQRSNGVHFHQQSVDTEGDTAGQVQKQVYWGNLARGREGTTGRLLLRTRDTKNSGTDDLFVVPGNVGAGSFGLYATIPDNSATSMPDNVPDAFLLARPLEAIPVPIFKLCRLAMGRLWIANTKDDPAKVIPSLPGRFGTFEDGTEIYPDPAGGEVTGLWNTGDGLLVFTASSTFLITQNSDGDGFKTSTVDRFFGCVAPSSFADLPDGSTVWLGREGFFQYKDGAVFLLSNEITHLVQKINPVRAKQACAVVDPVSKEYRCWVNVDNYSKIGNNMCFVYSPIQDGWRRRIHETVMSVCVTNDHRKMLVAAGKVADNSGTEDNGIWVLDHEVSSHEPAAPTATIETSWIEWAMSSNRKTAKTVYLCFRETANSSATIKVYRDWRMGSEAIYTDTANATLFSPEDIPPQWGTAKWGDGSEWVRRRPYWKRVDIDIPSCEVYKIVITTNSRCEFLGMMIDEEPKMGARFRMP